MRLHSDQPIQNARRDLLGRNVLAKNLAKTILNWNDDQSLVLALNGSWGSGKTSVKNMALEVLQRKKRDLVIIQFNPWEVAGRDALTEEFFNAIATAIPNQIDSTAAKECGKRLKKWGKTLDAVGWVSHRVAAFAKTLAPFLGSYGIPLSATSEIAGRVAETAKESADVAKEGASFVNSEKNVSLGEQKIELSKDLEALDHKILIVVDDIDRLTSDEVCLLFRLIKANCDFQRFIFLLLYDRSYVCTALDQVTNDCGHEFLEKIVQVTIDIGVPDRDIVRMLLRAEVLDALPTCAKRTPLWDEERWTVLADYFIAENIRHIRDLRRLVNAFAVSIGAFSSRATCEVNPIDLLVLEHLRLSEPLLYENLAQQKWILTGESNRLSALLRSGAVDNRAAQFIIHSWDMSGKKSEEIKKDMQDKVLTSVPHETRELISGLLSQLFPSSHAFKQQRYQNLGIETLRVGHREMFDVYFHRAVPKRSISQKAIEEVLKSASRSAVFLRHLRRFLREKRHSLLLAHLTPHAAVLGQSGHEFFLALMEFAEDLTHADPDWWLDWTRAELSRLFATCLCATEDSNKRFECVSKLANETKFIRLLFILGVEETKPHQRQKLSPSEHAISEERIEDFKAVLSVCAERLMWAAAQSGHRDLGWLLCRWREFGKVDSVPSWLRERLIEPTLVPLLLKACAGQSTVNGKVTYPYTWDIKSMATFLPREEWMKFVETSKALTSKAWEKDVIDAFWYVLTECPELWKASDE